MHQSTQIMDGGKPQNMINQGTKRKNYERACFLCQVCGEPYAKEERRRILKTEALYSTATIRESQYQEKYKREDGSSEMKRNEEGGGSRTCRKCIKDREQELLCGNN